MDKIKEYFNKLKEAHSYYVIADENQRATMIDKCEFIFENLNGLGVSKDFSMLLLIYGKEFVDSLDKEQLQTLKNINEVFFERPTLIDTSLQASLIEKSKEQQNLLRRQG